MLFVKNEKDLKSEVFSLFDEKADIENKEEKPNKEEKQTDKSRRKKKKKKEKRHKSIVVNVIKNRKNHKWFITLFALIIATILDLLNFIKNTVLALLFLVMLILVLIGIYAYTEIKPIYVEYSEFAKQVVGESTEDTFRIDESSYIYDSDGNLLAKLRADKDSTYIEYDDIPTDVIDAFVAVEDRTFWENDGIDLKGIIRVVVDAIKTKGEEMHGASTVTQQLARNIFLTHEVSLERKAKEMLIAMALTDKYSKKDIMEFYVNDICFGNAYYGIEAASLGYFNKSVKDLTLSQQVYLTALPNSPEYYNPYRHPERAVERRNKILGDMLECGYISQQEYDDAIAEEIVIERKTYEFNDYQTSYAIECVVKYLMKLNGFKFIYKFDSNNAYSNYSKDYDLAYAEAKNMLYNGGYKVYTTLDSEVQDEAQRIIDEHLSFNMEINYDTGIYSLQGSSTIIDNSNGKVIALVGGRKQDLNSEVYSLNRAFQSPRQPGSSIKPLIAYGPALENGYTPESILPNISVEKAKEKGVDIDKIGGEMMTFRSALEWSKNGVAWYLFCKLTPSVGMNYINNMQFEHIVPSDYYPAASLGGLTYGVTTVEMASAYSTLANHGVFREATCIDKILDKDGIDIYRDSKEKQVYKAKAADTLVDVMKGVLKSGTARGLNWSGSSKIEAAGKTGTTNSNKDGWLCGMTPYYTVAVWVGYDTPKAMTSLQGSTYPGLIWKDTMLFVTDGLEPANFEDADYSLMTEEESGEVTPDSYYTYLPGRDDSEVLSEGYTVANYRADRVIGETVTAIINQMKNLDVNSETYNQDLDKLYNDALIVINTIYSRNYTSERTSELNIIYEELRIKNPENIVQNNTDTPEVTE